MTALGVYLFWPSGDEQSPSSGNRGDPRLAYAGPFRNVDPVVKYVKDTACAKCHADITRSYRRHPMGRSLVPVSAVVKRLEEGVNRRFDALGSRFQVARHQGRVRHERKRFGPEGQVAAEMAWEVDQVLGSGARGRSFLMERDGFVWQTPISWYAQSRKWDLSPGFGPKLLTGRPVLPDCLFCHADRAHPVEGSVNRYATPLFTGHAIGCQRCHGPGELHVRTRFSQQDSTRVRSSADEDPVDPTIVNPRRLERRLLQAVCEQCHLTGAVRVVRRGRDLYDFRPGLPLEAVLAVFVYSRPAGDKDKAVNHVEQMYLSRCFQASTGRRRELTCISCHDPHAAVPAKRRLVYYRNRCLNCHKEDAEPNGAQARDEAGRAIPCRLPMQKRQVRKDSCIACHMKRYASGDIAHTASTDHRILRKGMEAGGAQTGLDAGLPIVSFPAHTGETSKLEDDRDRGVALVQLARQGKVPPSGGLDAALGALHAAAARDPQDTSAVEAEGYALGLLGRSTDALAAFERVLAHVPNHETALVGAASMAEALGRTETAGKYWRRAVAVNPWAPEYRRRLGLLLVKARSWGEAQPQCQAWVRLDPFSTEARTAYLRCLLANGDKKAARAQFARIEALAPGNLGELRIEFERKLQ
jgi:predicted CXXCH cytochrome family protein